VKNISHGAQNLEEGKSQEIPSLNKMEKWKEYIVLVFSVLN
jgi:hypothetical protein